MKEFESIKKIVNEYKKRLRVEQLALETSVNSIEELSNGVKLI